eukprot:Amastigsp_a175852_111.p4 type:complete len:118 gc:universal Amastigsp_a175852_111:594-241(-)
MAAPCTSSGAHERDRVHSPRLPPARAAGAFVVRVCSFVLRSASFGGSQSMRAVEHALCVCDLSALAWAGACAALARCCAIPRPSGRAFRFVSSLAQLMGPSPLAAIAKLVISLHTGQ